MRSYVYKWFESSNRKASINYTENKQNKLGEMVPRSETFKLSIWMASYYVTVFKFPLHAKRIAFFKKTVTLFFNV